VPHSFVLAAITATHISVAIAAAALVFAYSENRRARRADDRERRSEERAERAEERAERAEERAERAEERAERAERREESADLHVDHHSTQRTTHREYGERRIVNARLRNLGNAPARRIRAWLVDDDDARVSTIAGDGRHLTIARGDEPVPLEVKLGEAYLDDPSRFRWRVEWHDGTGFHERTTNTRPR
jgi:hypothetical protein